MNALSRYRKTLVAVVGAVATWASTYFPNDPEVQKWVGLALALATVLSVYATPNDSPDGEPADPTVSERGEISAVLLVILVVIAAIVLGIGVSHWFLLLLLLLLLVAVL